MVGNCRPRQSSDEDLAGARAGPWSATPSRSAAASTFASGDYVDAVEYNVSAEPYRFCRPQSSYGASSVYGPPGGNDRRGSQESGSTSASSRRSSGVLSLSVQLPWVKKREYSW